jgi:DCN1-like protein 1/2
MLDVASQIIILELFLKLCQLLVSNSEKEWQLLDTHRFTLFYCFVFFMCRERGQKSISVSTAIDAWRLSLTGRFRLLDEWCAFVQVHQRHAISEDTWRQVLEFSRSVHEDLSNYDPEGSFLSWEISVYQD